MAARRYILGGVVAAIAALAAALLVLEVAGARTWPLLRDATATADLAPWTGFFSTLGLLLWAAAAGICGLTGAVLLGERDPRAPFFLATAALLAYLALDDAYLFHEEIAPDELGVPERAVDALILLAAFAWAVRFRREAARSDRLLLAVAVAAFAASMAVDLASDRAILVEDWLKLSGIVALTGWCLVEALRALESRQAPRAPGAARAGLPDGPPGPGPRVRPARRGGDRLRERS